MSIVITDANKELTGHLEFQISLLRLALGTHASPLAAPATTAAQELTALVEAVPEPSAGRSAS